MHLLLIHQNFPGQFRDLAPAWLTSGHQVTAIGSTAEAPSGLKWQSLRYLQYRFEQAPSQLQRGLAVARLGVAVEAMEQQKWVAMATVNGECSASLGLPRAPRKSA